MMTKLTPLSMNNVCPAASRRRFGSKRYSAIRWYISVSNIFVRCCLIESQSSLVPPTFASHGAARCCHQYRARSVILERHRNRRKATRRRHRQRAALAAQADVPFDRVTRLAVCRACVRVSSEGGRSRRRARGGGQHAARSGRTVGTVMFFQSFVFCFPINNDFFSVFFSVFFLVIRFDSKDIRDRRPRRRRSRVPARLRRRRSNNQ
jgi:hypothetical protein